MLDELGDKISDAVVVNTNNIDDNQKEIVKYFIVEVATGNVSGPFKTKEDLESACLELELDISEGWITTSKP